MEAIVSNTETLELKVLHQAFPVPYRGCNWQVTKKDYDMGDLIAYGSTPDEAIDNYLDSYESRYNISRSDINYKWS